MSFLLDTDICSNCNVLRDDGLSYGDYVEQLTFLLFLKMADEQTKPPYNRPARIPKDLDWASLERLDGDPLESHYRHILTELGKQPGMLGEIFKKARPEIQNPATLRRLIVGQHQEWRFQIGEQLPHFPDSLKNNLARGRVPHLHRHK